MNKEKVLKLLVAYRHSMTEFDEEEMEYLSALVNFDVRNRTLNSEDVEYWKDPEPEVEKVEPVEELRRSIEYSKELREVLLNDLRTIGKIK